MQHIYIHSLTSRIFSCSFLLISRPATTIIIMMQLNLIDNFFLVCSHHPISSFFLCKNIHSHIHYSSCILSLFPSPFAYILFPPNNNVKPSPSLFLHSKLHYSMTKTNISDPLLLHRDLVLSNIMQLSISPLHHTHNKN